MVTTVHTYICMHTCKCGWYVQCTEHSAEEGHEQSHCLLLLHSCFWAFRIMPVAVDNYNWFCTLYCLASGCSVSSAKLVLHPQYLTHLTFCLFWTHLIILMHQNVCSLALCADSWRKSGVIWQHLREGMWPCWFGKLEVPFHFFGSWLRSVGCERGPTDRSWLHVPYVAIELSTEWYLTGSKVDTGQFGGHILICAGWYEKLVTCETEMLKYAQKHDKNFEMWIRC